MHLTLKYVTVFANGIALEKIDKCVTFINLMDDWGINTRLTIKLVHSKVSGFEVKHKLECLQNDMTVYGCLFRNINGFLNNGMKTTI